MNIGNAYVKAAKRVDVTCSYYKKRNDNYVM